MLRAWVILLLVACARIGAANEGGIELMPRHSSTTSLVIELIASEHYARPALDDGRSEEILDAYLDALDPYHDVFMEEDVARFSRYRRSLDDDMRRGELSVVSEIFALFLERLDGRVEFVARLLQRDSTLDLDTETFVRRRDVPRARNARELDEIWEMRLAEDRRALRIAETRSDAVEETLRTRYVQLRKRYRGLDADDVFSLFINAYLSTVDPHSAYFLPRTPRRQSRAGPLEGIGVQLRTDNEYVAIRRVFAGGAADRSGQLEQGDRIVAVDPGNGGEMTDVVGWTLEDVVDLIRGPKGSIVRLQVLARAAGPREPPREVALIRDKIQLEALRARTASTKAMSRRDEEYRLGVIAVPSFYIDYAAYGRGAANYPSTARDVERSISELQADGVDGIILDLRGNRGGALLEAARLTGLFIESGPVVQVRKGAGEVEVHKDPDPRLVYDGPLAVLVDRNSASSSEIFAAAIQDYGRGLIIGERTYGKGTVQQTFDLNSSGAREGESIGQLVLTVAEYFRVNGESTQLRGVTPDIELPATLRAGDYGEGTERNPLPWENVPPVAFQAVVAEGASTGAVTKRHEARLLGSKVFAEGIQILRSREEVGLDTGPAMNREKWREIILQESAEILADLIESGAGSG